MKTVFELILNLNGVENFGPKRTAGDLKRKMISVMCVADINLRSQLVRKVALSIAAWKAALQDLNL